MSWENLVSGGVAPPRLEVTDDAGRVAAAYELPPGAALTESYDVATVRHTVLDGGVLDEPRGFRYRVRVTLPYMEVAYWRGLVAAFGAYRAGARLRFLPHGDCPRIAYEVVPAAEFTFPYAAGKYVGYAGQLELVGVELLPFIPATWAWDHFCAVGETGYEPDEVAHFSGAGETEYAPDEAALFAAARGLG
jgi:hypothetical protein